jgi:hypothetical protein
VGPILLRTSISSPPEASCIKTFPLEIYFEALTVLSSKSIFRLKSRASAKDKRVLRVKFEVPFNIFVTAGGETFREVPEWWQMDYIHDFLEREYKNRYEDWEYF